MRILVAGGFGFIGRHVTEALLAEGHDVTILGRQLDSISKLNQIEIDLTKYDPAKDGVTEGYDVLIHLAAVLNVGEIIKKPKENILNNTLATLNLLEDIRLNNVDCLLVYASSDKVYGNTDKKSVTEDDTGTPTDPYGSSKLMSELLVKGYSATYGLKYISIRSGNTFGPGQSPSLFIPSKISDIINDMGKITVGDLSQYRNFVYVKDLADAFAKAISTPRAVNKTFNISSYNVLIQDVLDEIIKLAKDILKRQIEVVQNKNLFRTSETDAKQFALDCSQAKTVLKWEPQHTFQKAMELTFRSYMKK
jgi:UDP-glucose 4-epimerase